MPLGGSAWSLRASRDSLMAHAMLLHVAPVFVLPSFQLLKAAPHFPGLLGCQRIIRVHEAFRLHEHQTSFGADLDKIAFLKSDLIAQGFREHHLAPLPHSTYIGT